MKPADTTTHISLKASARLSGRHVSLIYRLVNEGRLGPVRHHPTSGMKMLPVEAIERLAGRRFAVKEIEAASATGKRGPKSSRPQKLYSQLDLLDAIRVAVEKDRSRRV